MKRQTILRYLDAVGESTVDEFVRQRGVYVNSWAPTFTHLLQDGLIRPTGEFRDTQWGAPANVWTLTPAGRAAVQA